MAVSTVSHVINGTKFVSPETREKVARVLHELNYRRELNQWVQPEYRKGWKA